MNKRASYIIILFIALISVMQGMAQSSESVVVYMGTSKNYHVDATPGSKYIWKIDDGSPLASTTNSVDILWTRPGKHTLSVQETTKDNCDGPARYLQVTVIALTATISGTTSTCQDAASPAVTYIGTGGTAPYTFKYNINDGTNTTVTTTAGDIATVSVPTIPGTFAYNLVSVTDSKGYTNPQTGTATITIKNTTYSPPVKRVVCPLQLPISWNKVTYTKAGIYQSEGLKNSQGCDSIATLELIVQTPLVSTTEYSVCASELPYFWKGYRCMVSDTYVIDNLKTPAGCDSVAILVLTVHSPTNIKKTATVCEGESYLFNGHSYSAPHSYDVQLKDINGCDSIIVKLQVSQTKGSYTSQSVSIFTGETYKINGNVYSQAGVYTDMIKVSGKCDDVVVTDLSFIEIPNTMMTAGRAANQVFMPGYKVQIFNRNGIMLYEGTDGWDGIYKNKPVAKDTYFYVLYYTSESHIKSKEGYITVLR